MAQAGITRRGALGALAAAAIGAAPSGAGAFFFGGNSGDVRRIRMVSERTGESIDTVYWIEGEYIPEALKEIAVFMRDWRDGSRHVIDTRTIDILAATQNLLDTSEPFTLISGYRSPATNRMLRRRYGGVARNSRHIKGEAADVRLLTRSVKQIHRAARQCNGGGIGRYSRSNFVHLDCGPVRSWGA